MGFMHPDDIRTLFSRAMSDMYRQEVPQYGVLCDLVAQVNDATLAQDPVQADRLRRTGQFDRLELERHGAIRLGTPQELSTVRRLFACLGMWPVGYYDLSLAGVPVHATAFRPIDGVSLERNPFRVFTSLLRLELIADLELRETAQSILDKRQIFTPRCLALLDTAESQGGLTPADAREFVQELLETFRWHQHAGVDWPTYQACRSAHALVADTVCFKGPHINHLTPRTLDIDAVQEAMVSVGLQAKKTIEGPPRRAVPILLRQTSFLALEEAIRFDGSAVAGTHTARFGEVEQRGCALTPKGRQLYDRCLNLSNSTAGADAFACFPDDTPTLFREGLAFFRFHPNPHPPVAAFPTDTSDTIGLVDMGWLLLEPITYEDFLPVSAAGIFRSNLGAEVQAAYTSQGQQTAFEHALGAPVQNEMALYEALQSASLKAALRFVEGAHHAP